MRRGFFTWIVVMVCTALMFCFKACKSQETSEVTISVEGKDLSDAEIFLDEKLAGRLIQTLIRSDGKILIEGIPAAKLPNLGRSQKNDTFSGCFQGLQTLSGNHVITLRGNDGQSLRVTVNIAPGYHLLTFLPAKDLIKWDNVAVPVGPERSVTVPGKNNPKL